MACGYAHTVTLSNDGVVHSFGRNHEGQLGLGHSKRNVSLPSRITNLPQIKTISCGAYFTVCVDCEGFMWSFGDNSAGQLGTGNKTNFNVPQQILNLPPVVYAACGSENTLIITDDSNLWSCGNNLYGQLCLENEENQSTFQQTSFSNIIKISSGNMHSLFQNNKGEIYGCGYNTNGELGLGHCDSPQIKPTKIPNLPSNITHFVCAISHNLFLDSEGNVFSVGYNVYGQLGLAHNSKENVLNQIPNIPPIQTISCSNYSSYLIDFEGNLWSFGGNEYGQLGHGNRRQVNIPTKIKDLKDIQQISYGCYGYGYFLAKDSQGKIFATGYNNKGQLGTGNAKSLLTPKEISPQYFSIWGENQIVSRAKSARK